VRRSLARRRAATTRAPARRARPIEGGATFGLANRAYRALWRAAWLAFAAWTPPFLHGWRRGVLRLFGARIAGGAHISASARVWDPRNLTMGRHSCLGPRVDCYAMAPISLGDFAIVSQDATLCAGGHDIDDADFPLTTKPIVIGARAWIAAGAFVGPGATIGEGAVLGARGVAFADLRDWCVYAGNPAVFLRLRLRSRSSDPSPSE
jgi:putative colanic acid biosynthesis acetyltransferase WcaF